VASYGFFYLIPQPRHRIWKHFIPILHIWRFHVTFERWGRSWFKGNGWTPQISVCYINPSKPPDLSAYFTPSENPSIDTRARIAENVDESSNKNSGE